MFLGHPIHDDEEAYSTVFDGVEAFILHLIFIFM